jgi:transposase
VRSNPSPRWVALGALMHKLCNIIFAILRDNNSYVMKTPYKHIAEYAALKTAAYPYMFNPFPG